MKKVFSSVVSILLITVFLSGCTTMMIVDAVDPSGRPINNATVSVDTQFIGLTPNASTNVSNFIGNNPIIRVTADGYHVRTVPAENELKVPNLIAGIFLGWTVVGLLPLLWVWGPRPIQTVMLIPELAD